MAFRTFSTNQKKKKNFNPTPPPHNGTAIKKIIFFLLRPLHTHKIYLTIFKLGGILAMTPISPDLFQYNFEFEKKSVQ